ncbi:MAG: type II toxin-antitoxin system RelE/ParE family toxin [Paludibacter sp.]|nr:type II toxin-antitoxin system RelE/ParE family toxin [Paludibacter sp.]
MYKVVLTKSAEKELIKVPKVYSKNIIKHLKDLINNPRPIGCKKLSGYDNIYRIRIGMYRIVYRIEDDILYIEVIKIGHRKNVYQ